MNKRTLAFLLKALISLSVLTLLYRQVDMPSLASQLAAIQFLPLAIFFVLLALNTLLSAAKWRIFLKADGIEHPLGRLFISYYVASFFTVLLPSTIGGDSYRIYDMTRRGSGAGHVAASVLADRLTGFLALSVLGLIFPFLGWHLIPDHRLLLIPLVVFGGLLVMVWLLIQRTLLLRLMTFFRLDRIGTLHRFTDRFFRSIQVYRSRPGVLAQAMAISFLFQCNVILAIYCLSEALGLGIPPLFYGVAVPVVSLIEAIPISIFGIGLRDTGYMLLFAQIGRGQTEAGALSILYVAATLVYVAVGGLVFLLDRQPVTSSPPTHSI
jgi:uncharacterized protein (TIRG00374 family)